MLPVTTIRCVNIYDILDALRLSEEVRDDIFDSIGCIVTFGDAPFTIVHRDKIYEIIIESLCHDDDETEWNDVADKVGDVVDYSFDYVNVEEK